MQPGSPARRQRRWRALTLIAFAVCAGCVQRSAPVVDSPVWDGAPKRPAPSAQRAPAATPAPGTVVAAPVAPPGQPPAAATSPASPAPAAPATPAAPRTAPTEAEPAARAAAVRTGAEADAAALPEFYTVRKGDTLYSIALDNGQDYKDVAAWNGLTDANVIRVDQQLRVRPPPGWTEPADEGSAVLARPVSPAAEIQARPLEAPPVKKAPKALKARYSEQALAQMRGTPFKPVAEPAAPVGNVAPGAPAGAGPQAAPSTARAKPPAAETAAPAPTAATAASGEISWSWPARGAVLQAFNQGPNPKGIAIGGELGQPVVASAAGKVVYSGSGLRGYGKLVIIKHDANYLSVYAHNRELRVKEGERVARGQAIAEMGSFDAERPGLHFEIRRLGKPVDPLQYLPAKGG